MNPAALAPAAIDPIEALNALHFGLSYAGGTIPIFIAGRATATRRARTPGELQELAAVLHNREQEASAGLALPDGPSRYPQESTVLWCWVQGTKQVERARRFRPLPSIVLQMGASSRRLLLWLLAEPIPIMLVESANRKLAYALHAPQKWALPDTLRVPLPNTFLRAGRKRPAPVLMTRLATDHHTRSQIVGRLRDPPAPYMQRLREGKIPR